jgi:hypothetical protein
LTGRFVVADNVVVNGSPIATDEVAGVQYQRIKVGYGPDGTYQDATTLDPLPVRSTTADAATLTSVTASTGSVQLCAANPDRLGLFVHNDGSARLYLALAPTASAASFTVAVEPDGFYEVPNPVYTGIVSGSWAATGGAARVTEVS